MLCPNGFVPLAPEEPPSKHPRLRKKQMRLRQKATRSNQEVSRTYSSIHTSTYPNTPQIQYLCGHHMVSEKAIKQMKRWASVEIQTTKTSIGKGNLNFPPLHLSRVFHKVNYVSRCHQQRLAQLFQECNRPLSASLSRQQPPSCLLQGFHKHHHTSQSPRQPSHRLQAGGFEYPCQTSQLHISRGRH